jgi:hypothetical protein
VDADVLRVAHLRVGHPRRAADFREGEVAFEGAERQRLLLVCRVPVVRVQVLPQQRRVDVPRHHLGDLPKAKVPVGAQRVHDVRDPRRAALRERHREDVPLARHELWVHAARRRHAVHHVVAQQNELERELGPALRLALELSLQGSGGRLGLLQRLLQLGLACANRLERRARRLEAGSRAAGALQRTRCSEQLPVQGSRSALVEKGSSEADHDAEAERLSDVDQTVAVGLLLLVADAEHDDKDDR